MSGRPEWQADLTNAGEDVFCRAELAREAQLKTCVGVPMLVDGAVVAVLVLLRHAATPLDERQLALLQTVTAQVGVLLRRRQAEEALRVSQERFQAAALATNDVIYDWDLATNVLDLSEAVERSFGYRERRTSVDWWGSLLHPDDAAAIGDSLTAAVEGDVRVWMGEYRFLRADGTYAHVVDRGYLMRNEDGKVVRMIGSMNDQTDRVRASDALREAKEAAEAAARAKSEFLANMSHEIRTPLTAVLGFADLLLDPKLGQSDRLNYAMTIRRNGEHLLALLNDILDVSKIEAGKLQIEQIDCSPAQLLTDVASLMRVRAVEKGLSFEVEYTSSMPAHVRTDPTRVRQIVLNLVSNAVKFTEQGSVRIRARCNESAPERTELVVSVEDTGIGISPEQRAKLFKPFAQADASMTRRYGGTGLGLGICAPLAAALGGTIDVQSELGRGSTFTFRVPVAVARGTPRLTEPREALTSSGALSVGETEMPASGTVLLAEDGRDNQILIARLLRNTGVEVTIVENGRQAVERVLAAEASDKPYDLVLMDMQMPELDGYGATAQLRGHGYGGSIVALTAHAMQGERERCLAAGCSDYLTKPIDRTRLITAVATHVRHARVSRAEARPPEARTGPQSEQSARSEGAGPLVSLFADDPDMADIVASFVEGLSSQLTTLAEVAHAGDTASLQRLAHQLKGAAGGYGFPTITSAAAKLESAARAGDTEDIQQALAQVTSLCASARPSAHVPAVTVVESPPKLLTIDDSIQIHELVEARLRAEGVQIKRALDAGEGLRLASELLPDLVLLDLDLPDANGLDVCRMLKGDPRTASIPVVFLTGATDAAIKAQALDLGAVDYVTKPFDAIELRARVRSALRTKRYHDLLANRAQLDGLTGLWNRAYFDERLAEEAASALRHGRPLSVAMVDVDNFKRLNDSYGHPFGDQVLQAIAAALRSAVRTSDLVCRYGGEEFALILRETGPSAAPLAAERMRSAVSETALKVRGHPVPVTVSVGVAASPAKHTPGTSFSATLVVAADAALYSAKHGGRNRVVSVTLDG